jgi:hypothetical protein
MTDKEKDDYILETASIFSSRQVDVRRSGGITSLRKGESITPEMREKLYAKSLELRTGLPQEPKPVAVIVSPIENPIAKEKTIENKPIVQSGKESINKEDLENILARLAKLEAENIALREKVEALNDELRKQAIDTIAKSSIATIAEKPADVKNVMGFSLFHDEKGLWYGIKRINGKNRSVYLGRDFNKFESKIKAWKIKNGFVESQEMA